MLGKEKERKGKEILAKGYAKKEIFHLARIDKFLLSALFILSGLWLIASSLAFYLLVKANSLVILTFSFSLIGTIFSWYLLSSSTTNITKERDRFLIKKVEKDVVNKGIKITEELKKKLGWECFVFPYPSHWEGQFEITVWKKDTIPVAFPLTLAEIEGEKVAILTTVQGRIRKGLYQGGFRDPFYDNLYPFHGAKWDKKLPLTVMVSLIQTLSELNYGFYMINPEDNPWIKRNQTKKEGKPSLPEVMYYRFFDKKREILAEFSEITIDGKKRERSFQPLVGYSSLKTTYKARIAPLKRRFLKQTHKI